MSNHSDNQEFQSHESIVELVKEAKHRPLPKSTKALFIFVAFALVFTGGIAYGKQKATQTTGGGLSLTGLSGAGGFGGAGFGTGRNRNNGGASSGASGASGASAGAAGGFSGSIGTATTVAADVAGTVVSIDAKSVVVSTLSGGNETFPITDTTRVRASSKVDLTSIKAGDIVTIKPDDAKAAKTITVVK